MNESTANCGVLIKLSVEDFDGNGPTYRKVDSSIDRTESAPPKDAHETELTADDLPQERVLWVSPQGAGVHQQAVVLGTPGAVMRTLDQHPAHFTDHSQTSPKPSLEPTPS